MPTSPNYGWSEPTVGGSTDVWGGILNTTIDAIDAALKAVSDVANAAAAAAGGTLTGNLKLFTETYKVTDLGSVSGTVALDLSGANFFKVTLTGAATFSFANPGASGDAQFFMLEITNAAGDGSSSWAQPSWTSAKWPGGSAPSLTDGGVDLVAFYTLDGGTTYRGALAQLNSS